MQISVKTDAKKLSKQLRGIQKKQIPFATSVALNRTADKARDDLSGSMKRYLDKPTRNVLLYALRAIHSKKTRLVSEVTTVPWASFLWYQVHGGTEHRENKPLVAPVNQGRVNAFGNIKGKRRNLIKKRDYLGKTRSGDQAVFRDEGRGKNKRPRLQFIFKDRLTYRPRWPFFKVARASVSKNFTPFFRRAIDQALKTAR